MLDPSQVSDILFLPYVPCDPKADQAELDERDAHLRQAMRTTPSMNMPTELHSFLPQHSRRACLLRSWPPGREIRPSSDYLPSHAG